MINKCDLCPKNQTELHIVANSLINDGYMKVCNDCLNEYKINMNTRLLSGELE